MISELIHIANPSVDALQHEHERFMRGNAAVADLKEVLWHRVLQEVTRTQNLDVNCQVYLLNVFVQQQRCLQHMRLELKDKTEQFVEMAWVLLEETWKQKHGIPVIKDLVRGENGMPLYLELH